MRKSTYVSFSVYLILQFALVACAAPNAANDLPDHPAPEEYNLTTGNRGRFDTFEVQAGETLQFYANVGDSLEPGYRQLEPDAWSVSPPEGASIDSAGLLAAETSLPHGTSLMVRAYTDAGYVEEEVFIYTLAANPLVGVWQEQAQPDCGLSGGGGTGEIIEELQFWLDGRVYVTWHADEAIVDYSAAYFYDTQTGALSFSDLREASYLPDDVDVSNGSFRFDDEGNLILENLWLGDPRRGTFDLAERCDHYEFRLLWR